MLFTLSYIQQLFSHICLHLLTPVGESLIMLLQSTFGDCLQLKGSNTGDTGQPPESSTAHRKHIYMLARPQDSQTSHICS
ncbi:hypothetical protein KY285_008486 [Solanum tuberosum]|nr:hypothetical protein KY285_008486 [Solanum tuberosum]